MIRTVVTMVALALAVSTAAAQEVKQTPEVKHTEPVVVTATKVETPREQLGASVTVIGEDELKTYNYSEFQEVMRQVPGVDVQRFGGLGRNSSIRIRGANPNQVQVLVDGMRVKSPTLGSAELSEISLDAIERIEVVRGPQSTLYGANAIGGVVNVITKKGAGPVQSTVHLQAGSYATFREQANVQGSYGGFNFNLSGSRYDTEGYLRRFKNDDAEQTAFAGRVGYDFPWKGELSVTGRYTKLEADLPISSTFTKPTLLDPNAQQQNDTWLYNVAYKQTDGEALPPRGSVALLVKEIGTKLRGGWARGFRAPTINDLLFPGFGNTALKPEHSESWEAGLDQKVWQNRLRFGTTYFHNAFRDLIQSSPAPGSPFGFLPKNVARAPTRGWGSYVAPARLHWVLRTAHHTLPGSR